MYDFLFCCKFWKHVLWALCKHPFRTSDSGFSLKTSWRMESGKIPSIAIWGNGSAMIYSCLYFSDMDFSREADTASNSSSITETLISFVSLVSLTLAKTNASLQVDDWFQKYQIRDTRVTPTVTSGIEIILLVVTSLFVIIIFKLSDDLERHKTMQNEDKGWEKIESNGKMFKTCSRLVKEFSVLCTLCYKATLQCINWFLPIHTFVRPCLESWN